MDVTGVREISFAFALTSHVSGFVDEDDFVLCILLALAASVIVQDLPLLLLLKGESATPRYDNQTEGQNWEKGLSVRPYH